MSSKISIEEPEEGLLLELDNPSRIVSSPGAISQELVFSSSNPIGVVSNNSISFNPEDWSYRKIRNLTPNIWSINLDSLSSSNKDELEIVKSIISRLDNQTLSLNWIYHGTLCHRLLAPVLRKLFTSHSYSGRFVCFDEEGRAYQVGLVSEPILYGGKAWLCLIHGREFEGVFQPNQMFFVDASILCG